MTGKGADGGSMVSRTFRKSLGVLVLSSLVSMLGALVDGMIIGHLMGSLAMAAYGIAVPITVVASGIAGIAASGAQSLSSKALARGEKAEAEGYLSTALIGYAIIGLLLFAGIVFLRHPVSVILGARDSTPELQQDVISYLVGFAPAFPAVFLTQILSSYMYLENASRRAVVAAAVGTAVNCAGDLVNVWVVHGGMLGMGLTTTISYYVMAGILLQRFYSRNHILSVSPGQFRLRKWKELTVLGLPSVDIQVCSTVRTIIINAILLATASTVAVSAFSVRMSMYNLYGAVVIGFGIATLLISSFFIGEENVAAIRETLKTALRDGVLAMIVLCALVCIFARPLVGMFTDDPDVAVLAVDSVRFFALSLPVYVINFVLAKYYQALGRSVLSHVITILGNLVYVCLLALVMGRLFSVTGIWAAFLASEILTFLTIVIIVAVRNRKLSLRLDDFMLLPAGLGLPPEEQYYAECRNPEELSAAIRELWGFLEGRGAEYEPAARIVLCAEELMQNASAQGGGKGMISVRLLDKPSEWALCLRDTGDPFDPTLWLSAHEGEKGRYGLRLVDFAADDIQYIYTLNMNQIRIRIGKESTEVK